MTEREPDASATPEPALEAMPEPAPEPRTPDPVAPAPRRRGWFLSAALAGLVSAAAGAAATVYVVTTEPGLIGLARPAPDPEIAALKAGLDGLKAEIAALPAPVASDGAAVAALGQRVDAALADLAAKVEANAGASTGASAGALDALTARVAALEARPAGDAAAIPADLLAETKAAQDQAKAAEEAARALQAAAQTATRQAAVSQILAAVDSGAPYGSALTMIEQAGGTVPEGLKAGAAGVPTLAALRAGFPEAARAGLAAALADAAQGGVWDRTVAFLKSQTGVRSLTPREGADPDAVLSRVEAALAADDLATVETGLAALPPAAQAAMAEWSAGVQARAAAKAEAARLLNGG